MPPVQRSIQPQILVSYEQLPLAWMVGTWSVASQEIERNGSDECHSKESRMGIVRKPISKKTKNQYQKKPKKPKPKKPKPKKPKKPKKPIFRDSPVWGNRLDIQESLKIVFSLFFFWFVFFGFFGIGFHPLGIHEFNGEYLKDYFPNPKY